MPQQAGDCGDANDEDDGPHRKEETEKAQEKFHRDTNVIDRLSVEPNSLRAFRGLIRRCAAESGTIGAPPPVRSLGSTSSLGFLFKLRPLRHIHRRIGVSWLRSGSRPSGW